MSLSLFLSHFCLLLFTLALCFCSGQTMGQLVETEVRSMSRFCQRLGFVSYSCALRRPVRSALVLTYILVAVQLLKLLDDFCSLPHRSN